MGKEEYLKEINNSEGREKLTALLQYVRYLTKADPHESLIRAREAMEMVDQFDDVNDLVTALIHISYASLYSGKLPEALKWAKKLLKTASDNNLERVKGTAFNIIGSINNKQNNFNQAIKNFLNALDCYNEVNDQNELVGCYNNLGMIHLQRAEYDEALNYLNPALQIAQKLGSSTQTAISLNIANTLYANNDFEGAEKIYQKCADYFAEHDQNVNLISALNNLGLVQHRLKEYKKAYENYQKSYELGLRINDSDYLVSVCIDFASLLIEMDKLNEALPYLMKSEELAISDNLKGSLPRVYDTFVDYYEAKKDTESTNVYLHKLIDAQSEFHKFNSDKLVSELEAKYKTQIYKIKSNELNEQNKIMQKQIEDLQISFTKLQKANEKLNYDFQKAVNRINEQDDLLSSQSRMAVMGEMVSAIAHQWRQPLNAISVLSQSIGDAWDFGDISDEFMNKQIELILNQINYMNETINDFRNYFKPEYQKEFSVAQALRKSLKLTKYVLDKENIMVITELDESCRLSGNPNELVQVFLNIINNARQSITEHKIIEPYIKLSQVCAQDILEIRIFNTGSQIAEENLKKLFEPYYTTRGKSGTGIGLHICNLIINNKFQGTINVDNRDNGVEFVIRIPYKQPGMII